MSVAQPPEVVERPPDSAPALTRPAGFALETARPPRRSLLTRTFLRLQYWYDRQTEPRRLLVGIGVIVFLATSLLYVAALGSLVAVSRLEEPTEGPIIEITSAPTVILVGVPATSLQPTVSTAATPQPTPSTESGGALIPQPDVPEVTIIPAPPRIYTPLYPQPEYNKPRIVAPTPTPARTAAPGVTVTGSTPRPVPPTAQAPTTALPAARTATPVPGGPGPVRTPTPAGPAPTTAPAVATPRPQVATPAAPPVMPTATAVRR